MPKRVKQPKRPTGVKPLAQFLVNASTQEQPVFPTGPQISVLMAELGRRGGLKGGKRRLETMSARQRKAIAKKAAQARWAGKGKS